VSSSARTNYILTVPTSVISFFFFLLATDLESNGCLSVSASAPLFHSTMLFSTKNQGELVPYNSV
jgi:hypothetical protein